MALQSQKAEEEYVSKVLQPSIVPTQTRTHDQFMEDQIKHEQKRFENLKDIIVKEEESEMSMYKPNLSRKTEELAAKRRGECEDVHARLNETRHEVLETTFRKPAEGEDLTFKPAVNKKSQKIQREEDISTHLQEDAKRRQEKKAQNDKLYREQQKLSKEETQKQVSKRSQKFIFGRFEADWQNALKELEIEGEAPLNLQSFFEVMQFLGFATESPIERPLLEEAWTLLNKGEKHE